MILTAKDKTSVRSRSPTSELVSCPNCTRAPKNRLIFSRRWLSWADDEFASKAEAAVGVTVGGGGVPLAVGEELLWRFTLELLVLAAGIMVLMVWCGDIAGDLGAMTRAPSGESGVLHCSLPANLIELCWIVFDLHNKINSKKLNNARNDRTDFSTKLSKFSSPPSSLRFFLSVFNF